MNAEFDHPVYPRLDSLPRQVSACWRCRARAPRIFFQLSEYGEILAVDVALRIGIFRSIFQRRQDWISGAFSPPFSINRTSLIFLFGNFAENRGSGPNIPQTPLSNQPMKMGRSCGRMDTSFLRDRSFLKRSVKAIGVLAAMSAVAFATEPRLTCSLREPASAKFSVSCPMAVVSPWWSEEQWLASTT